MATLWGRSMNRALGKETRKEDEKYQALMDKIVEMMFDCGHEWMESVYETYEEDGEKVLSRGIYHIDPFTLEGWTWHYVMGDEYKEYDGQYNKEFEERLPAAYFGMCSYISEKEGKTCYLYARKDKNFGMSLVISNHIMKTGNLIYSSENQE